MLFELAISMIRQFAFCPRIPYYREILGIEVKAPLWVEQGVVYHNAVEKMLPRRSLKRFQLENAVLQTSVPVRSERLGIFGQADAVLYEEDSAAPIEIKTQKWDAKPTRGQRLQLAAYGMAIEDSRNLNVRNTFFLVEGKRKVHTISLDDKIRDDVRKTIDRIREIFAMQILPDSSASLYQCGQCEYLTFCNDRDI